MVLKVGWERDLLIKNPTPEALAGLAFPNVPHTWEFFDFVGNDGKSFAICENQKFPPWDCLLWLGQDFGHITIKEDILPMGSQESMGVGEAWPLSIRGEFWSRRENVVSLPSIGLSLLETFILLKDVIKRTRHFIRNIVYT
jgi:hypothetical protein